MVSCVIIKVFCLVGGIKYNGDVWWYCVGGSLFVV